MKSPLSNPTSPKLYKSSYNTMPTFENTTTTTTTTVPFHNNINLKRRSKTPSFSSILLDAIYRSIDDTYTDTDSSSSQHNHTPKTTTSTTTSSSTKTINHDHHHNNNVRNYDYVHASKQRRAKMRSDSHLQTIELRHAILIDSWIDKQPQPQPQPLPQPQPKQQSYYIYNNHNHNSNDNKFDRQKSVPSKSNTTTTSCFTQPKICSNLTTSYATQKRETPSKIFKNTKLKALKLYSDLKKPKQQAQQPISPGARFAAFLNSLFKNSGGTPTSRSTTTATSAIKTTAFRQCSHTQLNRKDHSPENDRQLPSKGKEIDALMMMMKRNRSSDDEMINNNDNDNDDNDDDDSCASSDLFELENFGSIGVSRFSQELPVYGTTSFSKLIS